MSRYRETGVTPDDLAGIPPARPLPAVLTEARGQTCACGACQARLLARPVADYDKLCVRCQVAGCDPYQGVAACRHKETTL